MKKRATQSFLHGKTAATKKPARAARKPAAAPARQPSRLMTAKPGYTVRMVPVKNTKPATALSEKQLKAAIKAGVFDGVLLQMAEGRPIAKQNIKSGQVAMRQVKRALKSPGVNMRFDKSVPRYYADAKHPEGVVRVLGGKRTRGLFVDGKFQAR